MCPVVSITGLAAGVSNVTATLGGYFGLGKYPDISIDAANPLLTSFEVFSEYGLYGQVYFLQLAGYF